MYAYMIYKIWSYVSICGANSFSKIYELVKKKPQCQAWQRCWSGDHKRPQGRTYQDKVLLMALVLSRQNQTYCWRYHTLWTREWRIPPITTMTKWHVTKGAMVWFYIQMVTISHLTGHKSCLIAGNRYSATNLSKYQWLERPSSLEENPLLPLSWSSIISICIINMDICIDRLPLLPGSSRGKTAVPMSQ